MSPRWIPAHLALLALLTAGAGCTTGDGGGDKGGDTSGGGGTADVTDLTAHLHATIGSIVYVDWTQAAAGDAYVEYSVDPGEWLRTPTRTRDAGAQEDMLLGVPYGMPVTFHVVLDEGDGPLVSADGVITTDDLPAGLPVPTLLVSEPDLQEPANAYMWSSINRDTGDWTGGRYWQFIIDRKGRVVWAMLTPDAHWTIYPQVSYDGTSMLWDEATYWSDWDGGAASVVHRMKIDGTIEETIPTPGLHHCFRELADGTFVWGAAHDPSETLEERLPDGTQRTIWDCSSFHDSLGVRQACQSNSLWWDEARDTFLYSFYTTNSAVEIDHATGDTLRVWGAVPTSYTFDPPESQFSWQHGLTYTDEGHLLLSTYSDGPETAAREYEVDDANRTLHEVWNFDVGAGIYARDNGEAQRLSNGNTSHNLGTASRVREATADGEVVWDLDWGYGRNMGRSQYIEDLYALAP